MTFTTRLKEEISKLKDNEIESRSILDAFLRYNASINKNSIVITLENASVARYIYKIIKELFQINSKVTVRIQKRFRVKQIYILEINEKISFIKDSLNIEGTPLIDSDEEKISFIKGAFLGVGNVSNPKTSGYHLEFILDKEKDAKYITSLLNYFHLNAKVIKRGYKYISYIKMSESISDLIKMFKAVNSLFEFEDTRIYRDHKNMVNRLNNCETANMEKTIKSGLKQLEDIEYLEKNDLMTLLDDNLKIIIEYRKKYPEVSYQELANIISLETDYKVGKSGINHHFIKLRKIKDNHMNIEKK
jgi:DNA-binding protein WhiA